MNYRQRLGIEGENKALELLQSKGYQLLERNYRCRLGELDLVMRHNGQVIFVEVRTKASVELGTGAESITFKKRTKLKMLAQQFLVRYGLGDQDVRFDVISIWKPYNGRPQVEHLEGVF